MNHEGCCLKCFDNKLNATNENIRFMLNRSTCAIFTFGGAHASKA